jgi:ATP-dependent DNA ligase
MPSEYALLPSSDAMPPAANVMVPRRIHGATKALELGMMAEDWDNPTGALNDFGQIKVDGWRAITLGETEAGGPARIVTREGELLHAAAGAMPVLKAIEKLYGEPMMFDAEWAMPGGLEATTAAGMRGVPNPKATLWLFDAIPMRDWLVGASTTWGAWDRVELLMRHAEQVKRPGVGVLRPFTLVNPANAKLEAERVWKMGGEGIVAKGMNSPYLRERSRHWRKIKQVDRIMVEIVEVTAKGTLVCRRPAQPDRTFGVGTGIDRFNRETFLKHPAGFCGVEVEIEINGYTANGTPKHARFIRVKGL